jgi:hypothetical protein
MSNFIFVLTLGVLLEVSTLPQEAKEMYIICLVLSVVFDVIRLI